MNYDILINQIGQDMLTATKHQHENTIEIIQIQNGCGKLLIGKHIYEFKEGDVFLFDASSLHCTTPYNQAEYIRNKLIIEKQPLLSLTNKINQNIYFKADEITQKQLCELFESAYEAYKKNDEMLALSDIMKIFHICCMNTNNIYPVKSGVAYKIMKIINENVSEGYSLDELAQKIHLSKFHMCRKFKEESGITVYNYIKSRKISHAKKLLSDSDLSITYIAYETGFSDVSSFTKAFKQETGFTPAKFRKNK